MQRKVLMWHILFFSLGCTAFAFGLLLVVFNGREDYISQIGAGLFWIGLICIVITGFSYHKKCQKKEAGPPITAEAAR